MAAGVASARAVATVDCDHRGGCVAGPGCLRFEHAGDGLARGGRPGGHVTPDVAVTALPCRENPALGQVGMQTAPMAAALGWFRVYGHGTGARGAFSPSPAFCGLCRAWSWRATSGSHAGGPVGDRGTCH